MVLSLVMHQNHLEILQNSRLASPTLGDAFYHQENRDHFVYQALQDDANTSSPPWFLAWQLVCML